MLHLQFSHGGEQLGMGGCDEHTLIAGAGVANESCKGAAMESETSGQQGGGVAAAQQRGPGGCEGRSGAGAEERADGVQEAVQADEADDESRLGRAHGRRGKKSEISGTVPPRELGRDVWEELAKSKDQGCGRGFYAAV